MLTVNRRKKHEGETRDLVRNEPQGFTADFGFAPAVIEFFGDDVANGLGQRSDIDHAGSQRLGEVVEDCPRDPVDVAGTRDRDESVFDGLGVRVGGNYFAEDLVGEALRLLSCVYEIE